MKNILVHGISHTQFLNTTEKALEQIMGSPIRAKSKIRQFLKTQFNQANEHTLPSIFVDDNNPIINAAQLNTSHEEIDDSQLVTTLSKIEFLQQWQDDSEYIDRNFEVRAHDKNAVEDDISVDFRITFYSQDNLAYIIVAKNYGDGPVGETIFHLHDVPDLASHELQLPEFISKDEIMDAHAKLMVIYNAIKSNAALSQYFLSQSVMPKHSTVKAMMDGVDVEAAAIPTSFNRKRLSGDIFDANDTKEILASFDNVNPNIVKPTYEKNISSIAKQTEPTGVYIITTLCYDDNESGTGMELDKEGVCNIVCLQQDCLDSKLKNAFSSVFPDNDGTVDDVMNFSMVDDKIEEVAGDDEGKISALKAALEAMNSHEILDWLLDNFDINELIDNMLGQLTMGYYEIKWELVNF